MAGGARFRADSGAEPSPRQKKSGRGGRCRSRSAGPALPPAFRSLFDGGSLGPADRKLAEAHAELHTRPLAGQRQRDLALGQGLRLRRFAGAGGGARAGVVAEQLADVRDLSELAVAVADRRLAGREASPNRMQPHSRGLAVVAGDRSFTLGGLVAGRPPLEREVHPADRGALGSRRGCRDEQQESRARKTNDDVSFHFGSPVGKQSAASRPVRCGRAKRRDSRGTLVLLLVRVLHRTRCQCRAHATLGSGRRRYSASYSCRRLYKVRRLTPSASAARRLSPPKWSRAALINRCSAWASVSIAPGSRAPSAACP